MKRREFERMFEVEAEHWWYAGMREIVRAVTRSFAVADGELRVLDAGCGTGFNLSELGPGAIGVDASEDAIGFCRRRGLENAVRADLCALPFPDGAFDRVQSFDVLSDRGVEDDRRALSELVRVLEVGGLLVVRVPALSLLSRAHDQAVETVRRYSRSELAAKLEAAGLRVERISYCNTLLLPVIGLRALGDRAFSRRAHSDLETLPRSIEAIFRSCLSAEARWLEKRDLPVGASLIAVARK